MAQETAFVAALIIEIESGEMYRYADMPVFDPPIILNTIKVIEASYLSSYVVGKDGKIKNDKNGNPIQGLTDIRGLRFRIENQRTITNSPKKKYKNVPGAFVMGEEIPFSSTFQYHCTEGYGKVAIGTRVVTA